MWTASLVKVAFTLACCLWLARVYSSCPVLRCAEIGLTTSWCEQNTDFVVLDTYFYLKNRTKCSGCKKCIKDMVFSQEDLCPPKACPSWVIPESCNPKFVNLFIMFRGNPCRECDAYYCEGNQ